MARQFVESVRKNLKSRSGRVVTRCVHKLFVSHVEAQHDVELRDAANRKQFEPLIPDLVKALHRPGLSQLCRNYLALVLCRFANIAKRPTLTPEDVEELTAPEDSDSFFVDRVRGCLLWPRVVHN